jgi:ribosomal protein S27AE
MNKSKYIEYLKSDKWKNKKEEVFNIKWRFCEKCKSSDFLQVHHNSYFSIWREKLIHLNILCYKCHTDFHNKFWTKDLSRATKSFISWKDYKPKKIQEKKSALQRRKEKVEILIKIVELLKKGVTYENQKITKSLRLWERWKKCLTNKQLYNKFTKIL